MLQGAARPCDIIRRQRQVEPSAPDGRVIRPALQASIQESGGLLVVTHSASQIALGEPDAVVVRGVLRSVLDDVPEFFQEDRAGGIELPELLEGADAIGVGLPAVADEAARLLQAVLDLVEVQQDLARLLSGRPRGGEGRLEIGLGVGLAVGDQGGASEHHGGVEGELGPRGHRLPGCAGGVGPAHRLLDGAQEVLRLAQLRPQCRGVLQRVPGFRHRPGVSRGLPLQDRRPILPIGAGVQPPPNRPQREPSGDGEERDAARVVAS